MAIDQYFIQREQGGVEWGLYHWGGAGRASTFGGGKI